MKNIFKKYLIYCLSMIALFILFNCTPAVTEVEKEKQAKADVNNPVEKFFIFVDINHGTNGAAGTRTAPVDDIMEGISLAQSSGKDVCIAEGTYNVDSTIDAPTNIVMVEGVSIYGGYRNAGGAWARSITTYVTVITDLTSEASPGYSGAVQCNTGITRATVIDGILINAGYEDTASAILCNGGSPAISYCLLNGYSGANTGFYNMAVYCITASPSISNCDINGGSSHEFTCGIYIYESSNVYIFNNDIYGGSPVGTYTESHGVYIYHSSGDIIDNVINGGENGEYSYGIYLDASNFVIDHNEINGGSNFTDWSIGIYCYISSNPDITNNDINGGTTSAVNTESFGIYCFDNSDPYISVNTINGGSCTQNVYGILCNKNCDPEISGNNIFSGINAAYKYGIRCVDSSNPRIYNNIINAGNNYCSCIAIVLSSSPQIIQNTLSAEGGDYRRGIYEIDDTSSPAAVTNNIFNSSLTGGLSSYLYVDYFGGTLHFITNIADVNSLDDSGYNPAGSVSGNTYVL